MVVVVVFVEYGMMVMWYFGIEYEMVVYLVFYVCDVMCVVFYVCVYEFVYGFGVVCVCCI